MSFLRLSEFVGKIKDTIDAEYYGETFKILAETTDIKIYYQKTYAFLKLIEKRGNEIIAEISASIWSNHFSIISKFQKETGQTLDQNLELLLEVEVQFHTRYGLRLSIVGIDSAFTLGKLEQQKDATLKLLLQKNPGFVFLKEGIYSSKNALTLIPEVVQNIALICAAGSDGRRDFVHELESNPWGMDYNIVEFNTQVQGEYAAKKMLEQLLKIEKHSDFFDCVCIVRGGGSNTDFTLFDDYELNLQLAKTGIPVFTGIGHERNVSIADLMASQYLKTPTKCAAFINEHNALYLSEIINIQNQMALAVEDLLYEERNGLEQYAGKVLLALDYYFKREKTELEYLHDKFGLMHPGNVVKRGFSLVRKNNKIVSKKADLKKDDKVLIELMDGIVNATITE